ncbi:Retrotransposon protein [Seminavis robusta]|uniref:Retrotransposon protein n=1 Tax=Seminavis robusta TaxID=568900 RepID=A0A9N8DZE3_9STRA|nr:Retrotransposon protein [Seminavis robusta]|eukprot:Sro494_g154230.1 Retrotransposon protein (458) ;mRNA; f:8023-9396
MEDDSIPLIDLTSPHPWDPSCLDSVPSDDWYDTQSTTVLDDADSPLDSLGRLKTLDDDALTPSRPTSKQSIDRRGIIAAMADLVKDDLVPACTDDVPALLSRQCHHYDSSSDDDSDLEDDSDVEALRQCFARVPDLMSPYDDSSGADDSDSSGDDSDSDTEDLRHCFGVQTRGQLRGEPPSTRSRSRPTRPSDPTKDGEKRTRKMPEVRRPRSKKQSSVDRRPRVETVLPSDDDDSSSDVEDEDGDILKSNNRAKHHTGVELPPISRKRPPEQIPMIRWFFPGTSDETLKQTLDATTQYGTKGAIQGRTLQSQILSPNPILNIPRRQEDVATDTIYGSVPAVDDGSVAAQFLIGRTSHYRSLHPAGTSDASYVKTLMDNIRRFGAMNCIRSDNAQAQASNGSRTSYGPFASTTEPLSHTEGIRTMQNTDGRIPRPRRSWCWTPRMHHLSAGWLLDST